jgi:RNA polymerase sigma factor for flagellar operon FliA
MIAKTAPDRSIETSLWKSYRSARSKAQKLSARNALVEHYHRFVEGIATRLYMTLPYQKPCDIGDLVGEAIPALVDLFDRFQPTMGCSFMTFASLRIRGAMIDWLRENEWAPRLAIQRAKEEGGEPLRRQIPSELVFIKRSSDDNEQPRPIKGLEREDPPGNLEQSDWWKLALKGLNRVERLIILMYYREGLTLRKIGESLGLSESRCSQIHSQVMERLQAREDLDLLFDK